MENLDKDKLMELINDLNKERSQLETQKLKNEKDAFEKGLEFFKQIWQMVLDYKPYFEKLESCFYVHYKHTKISTSILSSEYIDLCMQNNESFGDFHYNVSFDNIEEHMRMGYRSFKNVILLAFGELQENPIEYYQEKITKQLADVIQKYNEKNNKLKKELGE